MAQLIQMRQKIKAIETIKKITHAMRLISMSNHTRMRSRQNPIKEYKSYCTDLFLKAKAAHPTYRNKLIEPSEKNTNPLVILVGSQKGLCGTFNSALFHVFAKALNDLQNKEKTSLVTVGKKAVDFIAEKQIGNVITSFVQFNALKIETVAQKITDIITQAEKPFTSVTFVSNILKTFFIQNPEITLVLPFDTTKEFSEPELEFVWEQSSEIILDTLINQYIFAQVSYLLFESIFAEQAARFLSMDSSTRNAETALENITLQYNKLRQAKITRELTELTGSLT